VLRGTWGAIYVSVRTGTGHFLITDKAGPGPFYPVWVKSGEE
jgi:hypothetical protein